MTQTYYRPKVDCREKDDKVSRVYLDHTLETADLLVGMTVACQRSRRKSWRVLTVTNDSSKEEKQLKNMLAAEREAAGLIDGRMPVNLFLFTTRQRLDYGDVLAHEWLNSRGERKTL